MYYDAFYKREIRKPGIYRVEGIGHDFMVGTLDFSVIDEVMEVSDKTPSSPPAGSRGAKASSPAAPPAPRSMVRWTSRAASAPARRWW